MKALVLNPNNSLELLDPPRPHCKEKDDVVVRVVQTGICGTDRGVLLGKFRAKPGVIMGHEAVGDVVEMGTEVTTLSVGDRVIINPTLYCGLCDSCRRGKLNLCTNKAGTEVGIDRDGAFAEYIMLSEQFLYPIPQDMSYDRAVGVEPLACVLNNLDAVQIQAGDRVTVLGGGPIGLVCALAADYYGCDVRVVEADPNRQKLAMEVLFNTEDCGVTLHPPDAGESELAARVVFDTVGSLLERACELVQPAGTVVIMGFDSRAEARVVPLGIIQRGISIVGAGDYNSLIFPRAIELARHLPLEKLITHRFTLDDFQAAFGAIAAQAGATSYSAMKVVLEGRTEVLV